MPAAASAWSWCSRLCLVVETRAAKRHAGTRLGRLAGLAGLAGCHARTRTTGHRCDVILGRWLRDEFWNARSWAFPVLPGLRSGCSSTFELERGACAPLCPSWPRRRARQRSRSPLVKDPIVKLSCGDRVQRSPRRAVATSGIPSRMGRSLNHLDPTHRRLATLDRPLWDYLVSRGG